MDVKKAVETRRAYRALGPAEVTPELIEDLALTAGLAPSCFNKQPWRFVFVKDPDTLKKLWEAYSKGNEWARAGSLVTVVLSRRDLDCITAGREYYHFDTGMASAFMILRATELGFVAHPIAGFDPAKVREILSVPDDKEVITLLVMGKHTEQPSIPLSDKQLAAEQARPERLPARSFSSVDRYAIEEA